MIRRSSCIVFVIFLFCAASASAQTAGSIRGIVYDKDFDVPLAGAQVSITETGTVITASDEGNFVFSQVPPGKYTLVFSKDGYIRQVQADVMVSPGELTEVEASLPGEFTDMEEFVVQDLQIGGTEAGLLMLRVESPALMDSISSELISQAGAGDAASALRLVAGATVQDGKYAVIRGLPDRYVNSQMNNVRLPTADPDKRAVQLDQFPSEMIESVQVSKTFTPDQQGDASGGAVNVVLKGIPDETIFKVKTGTSFNSQVVGNNDFLTYKDGGVNFWGKDDGGRDLPDDFSNVGTTVFGVSRDDAPFNYDMGFTAGGKKDLGYDAKVGAFASAYYKRYSSYYDNGVDNSYWQEVPGGPLVPNTAAKSFSFDGETRLLDITKTTEEVQLGVLTAVGAEVENHSLDLIYMRTQVTEDQAILAEDTRGKEHFFPGYDRTDPLDPGNTDKAPYLRFETLQYTERTTDTLQINGEHKIPIPEFGVESFFLFLPPEIDWTMAWSTSDLNEPDKRLFNSVWLPVHFGPSVPGQHTSYKPAANFSLGNFQETWQEIAEDSKQYFVNNKIPFTQWTGDEGYVKLGLFRDEVERQYDQESFSNFGQDDVFVGDFEDFWSAHFTEEGFIISDGGVDFAIDVDYEGKQEISAWYPMIDLPLNSFVSVIGGVRYEKTELSIVNTAEKSARIVLPGAQSSILLADNPGIADVTFEQEDTLPSMGLVIKPVEKVTVRGSYTRTVARQTFKELSPILQQEYAGGPVFIGNPELQMSALANYDWRVDYTPYEGSLVSVSWFLKEIDKPIEYIQSTTNEFGFTTPVNYPRGKLSGFEFESRQDMGRLWDKLENLSLGGNLTLIESEVSITEDEITLFKNLQVPITTRDMLNAPEYLYNIFLTYDLERFGTKIGLFYTVKGDTLVVGAGQDKGEFVPDVYAKDYGTLNLSISKELSKHFNLTFKIKNLTNPEIQEVYRSKYIDGGDVLKTSYTQGIEYSLGLSGEW